MTADAIGGVWQYASELAAALAPLGIETLLAVMGPASPTPQSSSSLIRVVHTGLPLDWLAPDAATVIAGGDAIAALAKQVNADVLHLNSPALAASRSFAMPVVAAAHGCIGTWWQAARGTAPDPTYAWHAELMTKGLLAADAVVAPSTAFAGALQTTYALPDRPFVIHNGRTPLALPDAPPTDAVFTAGRLWDEVKNVALLDRVAGILDVPFRAAGPAIGPGGERSPIRHLNHLGMLDETGLAAELAGRPIYVSAAKFEPFGLSVLEAAGAGCALVLSNIETFRELWTGAALLVSEGTAEAYVAAIRRIQAEPALRSHLGQAARLRAARYTPQAMAGAMAMLYSDVLAQPARAAA